MLIYEASSIESSGSYLHAGYTAASSPNNVFIGQARPDQFILLVIVLMAAYIIAALLVLRKRSQARHDLRIAVLIICGIVMFMLWSWSADTFFPYEYSHNEQLSFGVDQSGG